nr:hypothetical protein Q903MT_gene1167 [Picea sitchensis]
MDSLTSKSPATKGLHSPTLFLSWEGLVLAMAEVKSLGKKCYPDRRISRFKVSARFASSKS